jgi:hypothetical protein
VRPYREQGSTVPLKVALEYLNGEDFYHCLTAGSQGFKRSLPMKDALRTIPNIVQFLRDVLVSGRSEHDINTTPALKECYQNGWLQAELLSGGRTVYIFPTKIHQWYKFSFVFITIITVS